MLVIGLTGGIGSGKTTVADLFAKKGIEIIDTDIIAREVTEPKQPALKEIIRKFGPEILHKNGTLDRAELRKIIFSKTENKLWLEQLLHPLIRQEVEKRIKQAKSPYCIVVIPLLIETYPHPYVDRILVIDTSHEHQLNRTQIRDKSTKEDVEAILKAQAKREHRLALAHDIIENTGSISDLTEQIDKLHQVYLGLI